MKRRHIIASIIAMFASKGTMYEKNIEPIPCPWPGCRKKGKILNGDTMVDWYKDGKILSIHAFHIFLEYGPKWTPK